jgi:hypothetical protein
MGPSLLGGNETHPANDPLWEDEDVKQLLMQRQVQSEEERKEAKRKAGQEGRKKAKDEFEALEAKTRIMVANGEMTEDQREDYLAEHCTGVEKILWKNKSLTRRIKAYEMGNAESIQLQDVQQKINEADAQAHLHYHRYLELSRTISLMFNPTRYLEHGVYLSRNGFEWPSTVSSQSYFDIFAVSCPWGAWPDEAPTEEKQWRECSIYIHPDKSKSYVEALGGQESCNEIMRIWNASAQVVFDEVRNSVEEGEEERMAEKHSIEWKTAMLKVQRVYMPKGDQVPCFLLAHWVDNAAGIVRLMQGSEGL